MQQAIVDYLTEHPAQRLLWLAASAKSPELPGTEVVSKTVAAIPQDPKQFDEHQYDCAVLQDLPGPLSKAEAESLVAHLRDVNAQRILWLIGVESPWERRELLALGFHHLDQSEDGDDLYGFDIDNYKKTPDWLNPKDWANPERWDKKRW